MTAALFRVNDFMVRGLMERSQAITYRYHYLFYVKAALQKRLWVKDNPLLLKLVVKYRILQWFLQKPGTGIIAPKQGGVID